MCAQCQQRRMSVTLLWYVLDLIFILLWLCVYSKTPVFMANLINSLIYVHNLPETFFFSRSEKMEMTFSFHGSEHRSQTTYLWFFVADWIIFHSLRSQLALGIESLLLKHDSLLWLPPCPSPIQFLWLGNLSLFRHVYYYLLLLTINEWWGWAL